VPGGSQHGLCMPPGLDVDTPGPDNSNTVDEGASLENARSPATRFAWRALVVTTAGGLLSAPTRARTNWEKTRTNWENTCRPPP
jgi:hypothetical protein